MIQNAIQLFATSFGLEGFVAFLASFWGGLHLIEQYGGADAWWLFPIWMAVVVVSTVCAKPASEAILKKFW